jgi:hypothetical protein
MSIHVSKRLKITRVEERGKETVQITSKEHNGHISAVVGINGSESSRTYTVEFGEGSEADIERKTLRPLRLGGNTNLIDRPGPAQSSASVEKNSSSPLPQQC